MEEGMRFVKVAFILGGTAAFAALVALGYVMEDYAKQFES
jgi:hypothetical protein